MLYVLISGSRSITNKDKVFDVLNSWVVNSGVCKYYDEIVIIGGGCKRGVDSFLYEFSYKWGFLYIEMRAEWDKYGKSAGMIRNRKMIDYVKSKKNNMCLCLWDGKSKGCKNVIDNYKNSIVFNFI